MPHEHTVEFRVRYADTDQMGSYYNSRALDWFEYGRTELCRATGTPYAEWERRGVLLPVAEAHVKYRGRAAYDQLLRMTTTVSMSGRARMRFDVNIKHADGTPVCSGYTVHAVTDATGKPIRPPQWMLELVGGGNEGTRG